MKEVEMTETENITSQEDSSITYKEHPSMVDELKHSIHIHKLIMGGPTPQLAAYLVKTVDFLENSDEHLKEIGALSYSIAEAVAVHVQRSVDDRAARAEEHGINFPPQVQKQGDNIFILMGKVRSSSDKSEAKIVLLRGVADALRSLATFTKASYPTIMDARGKQL